jgi:hypothetical protein
LSQTCDPSTSFEPVDASRQGTPGKRARSLRGSLLSEMNPVSEPELIASP